MVKSIESDDNFSYSYMIRLSSGITSSPYFNTSGQGGGGEGGDENLM